MLTGQDVFTEFLRRKGLRLTRQREVILRTFLSTERHLSVEELYRAAKKKDSAVGQATVFRTLKLLSEAGIARGTDLGDKKIHYEHQYGHAHHDHLICTSCGSSIEASDDRIEKLQEALCEKFDFAPQRHVMEIFGLCRRCRRKARR